MFQENSIETCIPLILIAAILDFRITLSIEFSHELSDLTDPQPLTSSVFTHRVSSPYSFFPLIMPFSFLQCYAFFFPTMFLVEYV